MIRGRDLAQICSKRGQKSLGEVKSNKKINNSKRRSDIAVLEWERDEGLPDSKRAKALHHWEQEQSLQVAVAEASVHCEQP